MMPGYDVPCYDSTRPSSSTTPLANASPTGETPLVEQDLNFDGKALQLW